MPGGLYSTLASTGRPSPSFAGEPRGDMHSPRAGPSGSKPQHSSRTPALRPSPVRTSRPPLLPTNLNTPPTSPELTSAGVYRSVSSGVSNKAQVGVDLPPPAVARPRRLRNVKSQPMLGRANSNPTMSRSAADGKATAKHKGKDREPRVIRKMSSLGLRAAALARDSATGMSASSSVPDLADTGASSLAGRKRRRFPQRYTASTTAPVGDVPGASPATGTSGPATQHAPDVFTSIASKSTSAPPGVLTVGALAEAHSSGDEGDDAEEEEELAPLDPKIIFSKERFLSRHSQDFGHLYASMPAPTVRSASSSSDKENISGMEAPQERKDQVTEEERIKGREKRRSWMLAKAGLQDDVSAHVSTGSTGTAGAAVHRRRSSVLTGSAARSIISPDPTAPTSERRRLVRQSVDLRSQPILVGGPRPLSLVASQDLRRRLTDMGVEKTPRAAVPAALDPSPICEEPAEVEGLADDSPRAPFDRLPRPQHTRHPSSLSIPVGNRSRRASPAGSLPPPSSYVRQSDLLATSSAHSGYSTPTRGPLPPHLRNFSSSSTNSSSMSSFGAVIGGSPGASSSSCSSGGDHLGGPAQLAPEAFNFRMTVVDRPSSLRYSLDDADQVTQRFSTMAVADRGLIPLGSLRTDSRSAVRVAGHADSVGRDSILLDEKAERVKRRRARAFLVAGLKLEQGNSVRLSGIDILQDEDEGCDPASTVSPEPADRHGRRAGLFVDQPADLALLARLNDDASPHDQQTTSQHAIGRHDTESLGVASATGRKRYSTLRREKLGIHVQPVQGESRAPLRSQTPLLPLFLQPNRPSEQPIAGEIDPAHFQGEDHNNQPTGEAPRVTLANDYSDVDLLVPDSGASSSFPTLRRVGRLSESVARSESGRNAAAGPGIVISLFDSERGSDGQSASLDDDQSGNVSVTSASTGGSSVPHGLAPTVDPSPDPSSDTSTGIWGRGMDNAELARELFWQPQQPAPQIRSAKSSMSSIRKVQSDAGIGGSYAQQQCSSANTPITPSFVHAGSAGASPGREQKESWSKGMRSWLTGSMAETREGEMEKGFGAGRGGHVRKTLVQQYTTAPLTAPASQTLKEKKSWRPFSVVRRKRRGSLPEAFSVGQVNSMEPSAQAVGILRNGPHDLTNTGPYRSVTDPATETLARHGPPTTSQSPTLLSPPVFLPSSFTRANQLYSPMSAASFSPATPESLSAMTFPGMRVAEAQPSLPQILSPTSDYSPSDMHEIAPQSLRWRPHVTTTGLSMLDRSRISQILSGKRAPVSVLPTVSNGPAAAISPVHGLGFALPDEIWRPTTTMLKGKGKETFGEVARPWHLPQHETDASMDGSMPPIQVSVRPPTGHEAADISSSTADPASRSPAHHSLRSSVTRIASEPTSSLWKGDTLVSLNPHLRKALMSNANKSSPRLGDYRVAATMADTDSEYSGLTLAHHRGDVLPAKLFFMLGFLLGPWVWLIGGWGLSPAGLFPSATAGIHYSVILPRKTTVPRHLRDPQASIATSVVEDSLPVDKWVRRNRWAAVASSAVFIPAMCVGFAFVGTLI